MKQARVTAQAFLAAIQGKTQELELDGVGVVGIRSLTVSEAAIFATDGGDMGDKMIRAIELGLSEPQLSLDEFTQLRAALPGPLMKLAAAIMQLSGMAEQASALEGEAGGGS